MRFIRVHRDKAGRFISRVLEIGWEPEAVVEIDRAVGSYLDEPTLELWRRCPDYVLLRLDFHENVRTLNPPWDSERDGIELRLPETRGS